MKHPFLFISSLVLLVIVSLLGLDLLAFLMSAANTLANIAGLFLIVLIIFVDFHILKFSIKKFI
jgi:hypothetical protein